MWSRQACRVEADATVAEFEARHPDGADYVIADVVALQLEYPKRSAQ